MFRHLQIYDARERWMVGAADVLLAAATAPLRLVRGRSPIAGPSRILILRLERIGDLLMSMPAVAAIRQLAPSARIDLVVGRWNEAIARLLPGVDGVSIVDAPWLARGTAQASWPRLLRAARAWRRGQYDLVLNFEGDIRSHALMALSGIPRRVGFDMAGGGPLLTTRVPYDASRHVGDNLLRLVEHAFELPAGELPLAVARLPVPEAARARAADLLARSGANGRTLVGVHVGGGREIKQWDPARFGELITRLAAKHPATFVCTGSEGDRGIVRAALARVPPEVPIVDAVGQADLLTLAALIERCSVFITGDTGPMHLAAAVGAPLVAIFGPSDPRRWGPLGRAVIVHGDVPCRPCNRIRKPPVRCVGHVPDCLRAVTVDQVLAAVGTVLDAGEEIHGAR